LKSSENCAVIRDVDSVLTIGEVSRRSGVASSALRFYEERGLISAVRAGSGHRRYPRSVLRRIAFIVFAQRIGLALEEIGAELAKLPADRIPARQDWARLSGDWTRRIDQRIAELQRLRAGLTQCIGCGCLSIDKCQLANPADRAGRRGPGPRYWLG
jgi:MerR family transcriptional regulator, redox-sensitive transcriptional activator SoxR